MNSFYVRQPTPSSCGPTSIKIACNIFGVHQDKTPLEIFAYSKNQFKGSPWWRMFEMLDKLDIKYSAHSEDFNLILENAKKYFVLLSVDIGGYKHWCILTYQQDRYVIIDPEIGIYSPTIEWIEKICYPRACFHICFNTETKNEYLVSEAFKYLDEQKMVLVGEANIYFNKPACFIFTKHLMPDKSVFAYNKEGLVMYA